MNKTNFKKLLLVFFTCCLVISSVKACEKPYKLTHENGLYIVKINPNTTRILPYVSDKLETIKTIAEKTNANIAINTGFFDAKSKKSVSYITENGKIIANPNENENFISNPVLKPHLNKILNRGEFRLLNCNNKIVPDITLHNDNIQENCTLLSSTQAGPIILPDMNLEQEFFILKKDNKIIRDSVGLYRKTDRSMVAIKDNYIYLIITDEENPLNITEMQAKLKKYNFEKALGFDGGGSVSLFVKHKNEVFYQDREEEGASRAIKSALIVY